MQFNTLERNISLEEYPDLFWSEEFLLRAIISLPPYISPELKTILFNTAKPKTQQVEELPPDYDLDTPLRTLALTTLATSTLGLPMDQRIQKYIIRNKIPEDEIPYIQISLLKGELNQDVNIPLPPTPRSLLPRSATLNKDTIYFQKPSEKFFRKVFNKIPEYAIYTGVTAGLLSHLLLPEMDPVAKSIFLGGVIGKATVTGIVTKKNIKKRS